MEKRFFKHGYCRRSLKSYAGRGGHTHDNISLDIVLEPCTSSYIVVSSPDTDVFVLLLPSALTAHHQQRGNQTFFRTGVKEKYRGIKMEHFVSKLNESHVRVMIGFHAFTGCDQIRKYNGILKSTMGS